MYYIIAHIVTYTHVLYTHAKPSMLVVYSRQFSQQALVIFPRSSCSLSSFCGPGSGQGASGHHTEQSSASTERLPLKNEAGQMATDCSGT